MIVTDESFDQAIKENKFEEFYKKHFELFNEVN